MKSICVVSVLVFLSGVALAPLPAQTLGGCGMFPANNIWNTPIDTLPVSSYSAAWIASIGPSTGLHPDFGSGTWDGAPIGIPYVLVPGSQPKVAVTFDYADESDPGPYPVPANAPIEGGSTSTGDRHVLVVEMNDEGLYGFGQLATLLRARYALPSIRSITKTDGLTFKVGEIVASVTSRLGGNGRRPGKAD